MNFLKFKIGDKVLIYSKSTGRDYISASHDISHWYKIGNHSYPIGWITELRIRYYLVAYHENERGIDFYYEKDLRKIQYNFLEDDLFEI